MINIIINGRPLAVESGSMIIEAADNANITIPRFCYHRKLSVAANCRMCLVEVEKAPKPLPACATPVTEGMKVWTQTAKAIEAQKAVMEFLLINHPLDCPICDQSGQCELQDTSMGYGKDVSRFSEAKRVIKDKNIGPLIATDMTRCIHCTRCVRFGSEIAGLREMGATGRGENMAIGTYVEQSVQSELSANIIDLCPVGALTSKPFRFQARGYELSQSASIAVHDCLGSNIFVHARRDEVLRVVPRENMAINDIWLSNRDRFSYLAGQHNRLLNPKIRKNGYLTHASWPEALELIAQTLARVEPNNDLGILANPSCSLEELYLLQKWAKGLNCANIDTRLQIQDFPEDHQGLELKPKPFNLDNLNASASVLIIGANVRQELPILGLRLNQMTQAGGKVYVLNPLSLEHNFRVTHEIIVPQADLLRGVLALAKALQLDLNSIPGLEAALASIDLTNEDRDLAEQLKSKQVQILLGHLSLSHPKASFIQAIAQLIAKHCAGTWHALDLGANQRGAELMGCTASHQFGGFAKSKPSLNTQAMLAAKLPYYFLANFEPEEDCLASQLAIDALSQAKFVIACSAFRNPQLEKLATVILPTALFTEQLGTYINCANTLQSTRPAISPAAEIKPLWKILRVLGNLAEQPGFEYEKSQDVLLELKAQLAKASATEAKHATSALSKQLKLPKALGKKELICLATRHMYSVDSMCRQAPALAQSIVNKSGLRLHSLTAKLHNLSADSKVYLNDFDQQILNVIIDDAIPAQVVYLELGEHFSLQSLHYKIVTLSLADAKL